jgi:predicted RNA-binding Zn-ribbon protein involved in translation (DUF1610 family)
MSHNQSGGTNPLERLGSRFDDVDLVCSDCGFEDDDGSWTSVTSGDRILYRHVCPSCGSIRKRTLRLGEK